MKYDTTGVPTSRLVRDWAAAGLESATLTGVVAAAIHAACYLCDCAIDAGLMGHKGAIGDYGLVHALAHAAAGDVTLIEQLPAIADHAAYLETQLTEIQNRR